MQGLFCRFPKKVFGPLGIAKKSKDIVTSEKSGFDAFTSENAFR